MPNEIKEALLALAAEWIDRCQGSIKDVGDYRRIVQCVCDLTRRDDEEAQVVRITLDDPKIEEYMV
jgi:hypothetical protein